MTKYFITSYIDGYGKKHIYFFPGKDENDKAIAKISFSDSNTNYIFTRNEDGGINYTMNSDIKPVNIKISIVSTNESKNYVL